MTHDDRYESEWIEVMDTGKGSVTDDDLARHLSRRGTGTTPPNLTRSIAAQVAETKPEPGWRRTARSLRPVAALAACLVVVIMGTLIAMAPKPNADSGPGSTTVDPATRPLTVPELVRYMAGSPAIGTTVIVDDSVAGLLISCARTANCPMGALTGATAATRAPTDSEGSATDANWDVYRADPAGPFLDSVHGPLALRVRDGGGFTLLGQVHPHLTTRLAWSVSDVQGSNDTEQVEVVHGWLGASSIAPPCLPPTTETIAPTSVSGDPLDYSCGQLSFIADTATTTDTTLPAGAMRVQNLAYITFGAGPSDNSPAALMAVEGDYLVRRVSDGCPGDPAASPGIVQGCSLVLDSRWELIARLNAVTIPAASQTTPAPTPSQTPTGPIWDPTQRPLTPPEFLRVLDSRPGLNAVLIVDDQIVPATPFCPARGTCPNASLQNSSVLVVPPPGGTLTFTTDSSTSTPFIGGPVAIQLGGPFPMFLGTVVGNGQRLGVTAHDLAARNAMGGLFVVTSWIVAGLQPACPAPEGSPTPGPTNELGLSEPDYGCAINNWLTDDEYQPDDVVDNGNSVQITMTPPSDGLGLQLGAYEEFAPDPADDGHNGTLPRQGVFLVRDWAGRGEVLARLDLIPIPPNVEQPPASTLPASAPPQSPQPTDTSPASPVGSVVWRLQDLAARVHAGTIPNGSVVVTDLNASDLSPFWPPGTDHSCPQLCPTWLMGLPADQVTISVSELSPAPSAHVGRIAFLVVGSSLRLLGPVDLQGDGHPYDLASSVPASGDFVAVHGWLRDGLPVPCPVLPSPQNAVLGLDQQSLFYTCPGTWIQATSADPAVTNADGSGSVGLPAGGALVQDGADGSSQTAREGTYLIRPLDCFYVKQEGCQAITEHAGSSELIGEVISPDPAAPPTVTIGPGLTPLTSPDDLEKQVLAIIHRNEVLAGEVLKPARIISMTATTGANLPNLDPSLGQSDPPIPGIVWLVRAEGTFFTNRGLGPKPLTGSLGDYVIADGTGDIIEDGFTP